MSRQLPGHFRPRKAPSSGTDALHDNRTKSMLFQVALQRPDRGSNYQLLGSLPFLERLSTGFTARVSLCVTKASLNNLSSINGPRPSPLATPAKQV
jgi:hypothetical protein